MPEIAAVFDVDRTLIRFPTERLFFWYLLDQRIIKPSKALRFLGRQLRHWPQRFHNKSYLEGLPVDLVEEVARRCYRHLIRPRLSQAALHCLEYHRQAGHYLIILTGSLDLLIRPLQEELGAEELIAARLEVVGGRFTGAVAGRHPRGLAKLELLQEAARRLGVELQQSYAYADATADLPLLQNVGRPVAVNPSLRLRLYARRRQWPVRRF